MGLVLALIGTLVLGVFGVALLLVCIPWVVSIAAGTGTQRRLVVELRPFRRTFPARLRFERTLGGDGARSERARDARRPNGADKPARNTDEPEQAGTRRRKRPTTRMIGAAPHLLRGLLTVFRVEHLRLEGTIGLPDPADTGQLFGLVEALSVVLPGSRVSVSLVPDFFGPTFDARGEASLRVHLVRAIPPALRFGWVVYVRPA